MKKEREYKIKDASKRPSLNRISRLLTARMGTPESYGSCFDHMGEIWGFCWINRQAGERVSYNFRKYKPSGITSCFVIICRNKPA
jgi:hypothetical protein